MHSSLKYPYLLLAPDYRESSLGIEVMHRLCHLLNEKGGRAWMVGCEVNPQWNTPVLNERDFTAIHTSRLPFIAIYPDVVTGNPLSAPVCVRYMLNREGVIMGNAINAEEKDLFFWYRDEFADKEVNPQILRMEAYDLSLFCDDNPVKDLDILYVNRVPTEKIDFKKLPANIHILSMRNPLSLKELAQVLKRGRVLYTYESSGTCTLANLCGCPVVGLTAPGHEHYAINEDTLKDNGNGGIGWQDDAESLAEIRKSLPQVRDYYLAQRTIFGKQLENFIAITQQHADDEYQKKPADLALWLAARKMTPGQTLLWNEKLSTFNTPASILIFIDYASGDESALALTLNSLKLNREYYPAIQVMVYGDIEAESLPDWVLTVSSGSIVNTLNELLTAGTFDWLQKVVAGCEYTLQGLAMAGINLNEASSLYALYGDEIVKGNTGELESVFRPDFNLDLFLSTPWWQARNWIFRADALRKIGGFNASTERAFEFDAILRLIESNDLAGIGHLSEPLLIISACMHQPEAEEPSVLTAHLQRRGYPDAQVFVEEGKPYRIHYHHGREPLISVIVLAGSQPEPLQQSISSFLEKTAWPNYEIIVASVTQNDATFGQWLKGLATVDPERIRVLYLAGNSATELVNQASVYVRGEFLLLLDTNTLIVQQNWLHLLMNEGLRPEVGIAGGKLIDVEGNILSGGQLLGHEGLIANVGYGENMDSQGYLQRLHSTQNYSVLSSQCLLIKTAIWRETGGFNLQLADPIKRDIDFCLTVRTLGYMSVWTPYAVIALTAVASKHSTPAIREHASDGNFWKRWLPVLANDPASNSNFDLDLNVFSPEWRQALSWRPLSWHPVPVLMALTGDATAPEASELADAGLAEVMSVKTPHSLPLLTKYSPQSLVIQQPLTKELTDWISQVRNSGHYFISGNIASEFQLRGTESQQSLRVFDRLIVQSKKQAEALNKNHHDVRFVPRTLHKGWCNLNPPEQSGGKIRILCNTRDLLSGDLELVSNIIRELAGEVEWIVLGPCPAKWQPWIAEHHRARGAEHYPHQLAGINAELAILPREDSTVNRFKDAFSLLELAACGIPVVCSAVDSLQNHISATRVKNRHKDWLLAVRSSLYLREDLATRSAQLRQELKETDWSDEMMLQQRLKAWLP